MIVHGYYGIMALGSGSLAYYGKDITPDKMFPIGIGEIKTDYPCSFQKGFFQQITYNRGLIIDSKEPEGKLVIAD